MLSNNGGGISKICWLASGNDELINRDKASLDIFWVRDESVEEPDNPRDADVLVQEIVDDLETALEQFREFTEELGVSEPEPNIDRTFTWLNMIL